MQLFFDNFSNIILLLIAVMQAFAALFAYLNRQTLQEVKHATDGMKDALVNAAAKENYAAGKQEGADQAASKAATLAEGVLQGKTAAEIANQATPVIAIPVVPIPKAQVVPDIGVKLGEGPVEPKK